MYRRLRHLQRRLFSLRHWRVRLVFWLGALLLGAVAAGFALAATYADKSFHRLVDAAPYLALLLPPLGLIAIAWITRRYFLEAGGSGIPQAIAALSIKHEQQRNRILAAWVAAPRSDARDRRCTSVPRSCPRSDGSRVFRRRRSPAA
jgi:H+/Cl- antiporter ClcA